MSWEDLVDTKERLAALPLMDVSGDKRRIMGSATFVLPGLFITAKHNIAHYLKEHEGVDIGDYSWEPNDLDVKNFNIEVFLPMKDDTVLVWHIGKVHIVLDADLALLVASGCDGPDEKLTHAGIHVNIDLHIPAVGSSIVAVGYPKTKNTTIGKGPYSHHGLQLTRAPGIVDAIDKSTFSISRPPRVQSNAYIEGGMSGGPAFNEHGRLFAITTDSLEPTKHHEHYSIFTPLAACMLQPFKLPTLDDPMGKQYKSLYDLTKKGYLKISGLDHFQLHDDSSYTFDTLNIQCPECTTK